MQHLAIKGDELLPVEVKAASLTSPRITRGYRRFLKTYKPRRGVVVIATMEAEKRIEETSVLFLPLNKLCTHPAVFDDKL